VLGLALAPVVSHSLAAMLAGGGAQNTMVLDAALDLRVFGFAALIAVTSGVVIGLIPALKATGGDLNDQIKDGQHATKAHERSRMLPRVLMASQVALALVLVAGAGLLATSLMRLYRSGLGFDPKGVVNIACAMDKQQLEGDQLMELYRQIGEGLGSETLQKVANVSSWLLPFEGIYQAALAGLTADTVGFTKLAINLGPFGRAHAVGVGLWLWALVYLGLVGAWALRGFARRDL